MTVTYREIKADILSKISDGRLKPGALLPSEIELAESYVCARATVNRAMRELTEEGIVERKRKAGTRVRMSPLREARFEIPVVRKEIEALGAAYAYRLIAREETTAPGWLGARFEVAETAPVLHLTCLHFAGAEPYQLEDRWINLEALPEAAAVDFEGRGPNEWLLETVPYTDAEISFSATHAEADMARHLGCQPGDALFQAERATWWQGQAITHVRLVFRRGHRMTTRY